MPAIISYINHADTATLTSTDPHTGSASVLLRPLTELQVPWAKGLCRGPTTGSGTLLSPRKLNIKADLGTSQFIHVIAVVGLNGASASSVSMRVRVSNVSLGGYELVNTTVSLLPQYNRGGGELALYWLAPDFTLSARYVETEISMWGSAPSYVDARRLLIMSGGGSTLGFDRGWTDTDVNPTLDVQTDAGGVFIEENVQSRVMQFAMTGRTVAEMKTNITDGTNCDSLQKTLATAGKRKEVIVCPRSTDASLAVYGRITEWSPIVHEMGGLYGCDSVTVKSIPHPPL